MREISKEEFSLFAEKEFPGKPMRYADSFCYVQAGNHLGEYLHYELHSGKVHLHIEGRSWKPIRDYLWNHVIDSRVKDSHWGRKGCQWTVDCAIENSKDVKEAFLLIKSIFEPHIQKFESYVLRESNIEKSDNGSVDANYLCVGKIIQKDLSIPDYQRPYRWNERNVEQLLNDIYNSWSDGHLIYLIGTVILHEENEKLNLVDGQQRLTTLCLIIITLGYEGRLPQLSFNHSDSFAHIKENYRFIQTWVVQNIRDKKVFLDFVLESCQFVTITVKKLREAFQMFESQNGRGKELEAYNLLKAYHIRAMFSENQVEKVECDKRWEAAAMFTRNNNHEDLLQQLFNEQLYRSRIWSKGESAYRFSKKKVEEFKGVTISKDKTLDFAYQNVLLQQEIANYLMRNMNVNLFKIKSRFIHGDPDNINPFVNVTQLILNGKSFFDYVETYVEIYKRLFVHLNSSQLSDFKDFYKQYCLYNGYNIRRGDGYIREVFKSAIMVLFDKFGEIGINKFYKDLYICIYCFRLQRKQVRYETMAKNVVWIFQTILKAKSLSDLAIFKKESQSKSSNIEVKYDLEKVASIFKMYQNEQTK